jgi:hypothetical protein
MRRSHSHARRKNPGTVDPPAAFWSAMATAQNALATIARQVGGRGLFKAFDGTQFGTKTGDNVGGGKECHGDPASGVSGDPDCNDHDVDD